MYDFSVHLVFLLYIQSRVVSSNPTHTVTFGHLLVEALLNNSISLSAGGVYILKQKIHYVVN